MKFVILAILALLLFPLLRKLQKRPVDDAPLPPAPLPPSADRKRLPARPSAGKGDERDEADEADETRAKAAADARFQDLLRTVIVLDDNAWAACTIDGVKEDWARFTSEPVRGFAAVMAGRHRVVTSIDGRDAVLDFVLRPGDVLVRKLDRAAGKWVALDAEELTRVTARAKGGEKGALGDALVSYRSTMGIARTQRGTVTSPDAVVLRVRDALGVLVERAALPGANLDALVAEAATLGLDLLGVPLTREQIDALAELGKRAPRLGEAVLPGA